MKKKQVKVQKKTLSVINEFVTINLNDLCQEDVLKEYGLEEIKKVLMGINSKIESQLKILDHLDEIRKIREATLNPSVEPQVKVKRKRGPNKKKKEVFFDDVEEGQQSMFSEEEIVDDLGEGESLPVEEKEPIMGIAKKKTGKKGRTSKN